MDPQQASFSSKGSGHGHHHAHGHAHGHRKPGEELVFRWVGGAVRRWTGGRRAGTRGSRAHVSRSTASQRKWRAGRRCLETARPTPMGSLTPAHAPARVRATPPTAALGPCTSPPRPGRYKGGYWEERDAGQFTGCRDIFGPGVVGEPPAAAAET